MNSSSRHRSFPATLLFAFVLILLAAAPCSAADVSYSFKWDANHPNENVVAYRIYWSTVSENYISANRVEIPVESLSDTANPHWTITIQEPPPGQIYFFVITAVDNVGLESDYSFEITTSAPDIKANGSDGPVIVSTTDTLILNIELDAGANAGDDVDWWVLADTPFGWYHYYSDNWKPGFSSTIPGPLVQFDSTEILNRTLPAGLYTFYFGFDLNKNGQLDLQSVYYDSVNVTITP